VKKSKGKEINKLLLYTLSSLNTEKELEKKEKKASPSPHKKYG